MTEPAFTPMLLDSVDDFPIVDRSDMLFDEQRGGGTGLVNPVSTRYDRQDGRYAPHWHNEIEHAIVRGTSRIVADGVAMGYAVAENLTNYVIGSGFKIEANVKGENGVDKTLAQACQALIDEFLQAEFHEGIQRELHDHSRRDGEIFPTLWGGRACPRMRLVTGEYIAEPRNTRDLDEYLGLNYPTSWSYGVMTPAGDTADHVAYMAIWDDNGNDCDVLPYGSAQTARRLRTGTSLQIRTPRNTPAHVKRGCPDYYPVLQDLKNDSKLVRNLVSGAAVQASIAWVEEYAATEQQAASESLSRSESKTTRSTPMGQRTSYGRRFERNTIVKIGPGKKYVQGPMGAERIPAFETACALAARRIGIRWCMPEFMISGDASNANYASTSNAEHPWAQSVGSAQRYYGRHFVALCWLAIEWGMVGGRLDRFGVTSLTNLQRRIELTATPGTTTGGQTAETEQQREIQKRNGVLSTRTWQLQVGLDPETENANGAKPDATGLGLIDSPDPTAPPAGPAAAPTTDVQQTALNGAQVASLMDIVTQVADGSMPIETARAMIGSAFPALPQADVDDIIQPLLRFRPATPAPAAAPITPPTTPPLNRDDMREAIRAGARDALIDSWKRYP